MPEKSPKRSGKRRGRFAENVRAFSETCGGARKELQIHKKRKNKSGGGVAYKKFVYFCRPENNI